MSIRFTYNYDIENLCWATYFHDTDSDKALYGSLATDATPESALAAFKLGLDRLQNAL